MNSSIKVARQIRAAISNGVTEKYTAAQIDEVRKPLVEGLNRLYALVDANCVPQAKRAYDAALRYVG